MRVCGATKERPAAFARACWCHGLFCYRGGAKHSAEFWRETRTRAPLVSRSELELVLTQADLFDGNALRDKWRARLDGGLDG